jgi:hypothetical protein
MDLKEFTKQALVQIVEGTKEADAIIKESNAHIHLECEDFTGTSYPLTNVDFDVAITATETEGANGGGGIKVMGVFNAGGEIKSRTENQTVSRVKYTIPLVLGSKN